MCWKTNEIARREIFINRGCFQGCGDYKILSKLYLYKKLIKSGITSVEGSYNLMQIIDELNNDSGIANVIRKLVERFDKTIRVYIN